MKKLAPFEEAFDNAVHYGFKHYTSNETNDLIADIYTAAGGSFYRNWTCGHCVMQLFKGAGALYFKTKEENEVHK